MPNTPSPVDTISREKRKNKYDVRQGTFIQAVVSVQRKSQIQMSKDLGVSDAFVKQIIWGRKKSERIQGAMAQYLGFSSWARLKEEQKTFEKDWIKWRGLKK